VSDFASLGLAEPLLRALQDIGYTTPTPIQQQAIGPVLQGRDLIAVAQTGTGKTAAFSLPMLQLMAARVPEGRRAVRGLILTPTRELASQIGESLTTYGRHLNLRHTVIFGGVGQRPQEDALRRQPDIVVATPGRMLDLCGQGFLALDRIEFFVLDEADRMLDMGFIHDIRKVLRMLPPRRQNLMFSATMPVTIQSLAQAFLHEPAYVEVTPPATTVERIQQQVMFVQKADKRRLLAQLLREVDLDRAIVFTRTKHGADRVVKELEREGLPAAAIHGNKSQNARVRALDGFKSGAVPVLVATDVASRGLDIDGVSHVFNYDLPNEPESYVHRIGRTGRAGRDGIAISFCDEEESDYLRDIERTTGAQIDRVMEHPWHFPEAIPMARGGGQPRSRPAPQPQRGGGGGGGGGRAGQGGAGSGELRGRGANPARPLQPAASPQPPAASAAAGTESGEAARRRRRRRRGGGGSSNPGGPSP
jgi:ATP-dependent RNA helicase RhlE